MPLSLNIPALSLVLLLCALLTLRWLLRKSAARSTSAPWPFYAKRPLASPEQVLYQRLVTALPGYTVLHGVALSSVLGVKRGADAARWTKRIRQLDYDFVVCTHNARVLAAIVLDDPSRGSSDSSRQIRERASATAGIRLLRWQSNALPDQSAILAALGEQAVPFFEDTATSTNASWWPPVASAGRSAPAPKQP
jgi:hypothetical protein